MDASILAQWIVVGALSWIVTLIAAFFTGYWCGETATADAYKEVRDFYNGSAQTSTRLRQV